MQGKVNAPAQNADQTADKTSDYAETERRSTQARPPDFSVYQRKAQSDNIMGKGADQRRPGTIRQFALGSRLESEHRT